MLTQLTILLSNPRSAPKTKNNKGLTNKNAQGCLERCKGRWDGVNCGHENGSNQRREIAARRKSRIDACSMSRVYGAVAGCGARGAGK